MEEETYSEGSEDYDGAEEDIGTSPKKSYSAKEIERILKSIESDSAKTNKKDISEEIIRFQPKKPQQQPAPNSFKKLPKVDATAQKSEKVEGERWIMWSIAAVSSMIAILIVILVYLLIS